jgi:hypothetical protein
MNRTPKPARSLAVICLVLATAVAAVEGDASPPDALAPLAWLAGSCWTGTFADGKTKGLVCYEWMLDGKFLRSRHRVSSDGAPYAGETVFGRDGATGGLRFDYYNVLGDAIRGPIEVAGGALLFPSEKYEKDGKSFELRSVWRRDGEDRYVAVTERLEEGAWRPFMTIFFVRSGPASDWSEE